VIVKTAGMIFGAFLGTQLLWIIGAILPRACGRWLGEESLVVGHAEVPYLLIALLFSAALGATTAALLMEWHTARQSH